MEDENKVYVALGDSMSVDLYTGVRDGGAVSQFFAWLKWIGKTWRLDDRTADMTCMGNVPTSVKGDLITLTIGGNDLLFRQEQYTSDGLASFETEHLSLLQKIRESNPESLFVVGNIYSPQRPLPDELSQALVHVNSMIAANVQKVGALLADINDVFRGHEAEYLCYDIEPSYKGATVIASLFKAAVIKAGGP